MNIEQNTSSDFLYQKKATLASKYISEFHKFWEANHKEILIKLGQHILFSVCIILKENFSIFFSLFKMNKSQLWIVTQQKS